jgi:hypothetical protein
MPAEGLLRFAFATWLGFTMVGGGLAPLAGSEIERPNFSKRSNAPVRRVVAARRAWRVDLGRYTQMSGEATYICDACGEEIVIPIDLSQG